MISEGMASQHYHFRIGITESHCITYIAYAARAAFDAISLLRLHLLRQPSNTLAAEYCAFAIEPTLEAFASFAAITLSPRFFICSWLRRFFSRRAPLFSVFRSS